MIQLGHIVLLVLQIMGVILLADFVSGFVHWLEDRFGEPETPIIGDWIVKPNILHHHDPLAFTSKGWWASSWDLFTAAVIILVLSIVFDFVGWQVILFCVLSANANQFHKWTHIPRKDLPLLIRSLMDLRLIQDSRHHMQHHSGDKNTAYCVITPWLNPVLDYLGFWRFIEVPFKKVMSIRD